MDLINFLDLIEVSSPLSLREHTVDLPKKPANLKWNKKYHNIIEASSFSCLDSSTSCFNGIQCAEVGTYEGILICLIHFKISHRMNTFIFQMIHIVKSQVYPFQITPCKSTFPFPFNHLFTQKKKRRRKETVPRAGKPKKLPF